MTDLTSLCPSSMQVVVNPPWVVKSPKRSLHTLHTLLRETHSPDAEVPEFSLQMPFTLRSAKHIRQMLKSPNSLYRCPTGTRALLPEKHFRRLRKEAVASATGQDGDSVVSPPAPVRSPAIRLCSARFPCKARPLCTPRQTPRGNSYRINSSLITTCS
jgi:hypothetical protein